MIAVWFPGLPPGAAVDASAYSLASYTYISVTAGMDPSAGMDSNREIFLKITVKNVILLI